MSVIVVAVVGVVVGVVVAVVVRSNFNEVQHNGDGLVVNARAVFVLC